MPQFDRGQVVIVACDDAAPQGHHGHDKGKAKHSQPCPYGAASALNGLDQPTPTFVPPPRATSSLASSILLRSSVTASHAPRPPSRAPPTST
jgi:hypothetical protein